MTRQYSDAELAEYVNDDGLEYIITHGIGAEAVADSTTRILWRNTARLLELLKARLDAARVRPPPPPTNQELEDQIWARGRISPKTGAPDGPA